jgi:hypothetical protein
MPNDWRLATEVRQFSRDEFGAQKMALSYKSLQSCRRSLLLDPAPYAVGKVDGHEAAGSSSEDVSAGLTACGWQDWLHAGLTSRSDPHLNDLRQSRP